MTEPSAMRTEHSLKPQSIQPFQLGAPLLAEPQSPAWSGR